MRWLLLVCLWCAGCAAAPAVTPQASPWGTPRLLGTAASLYAPALLADSARAWYVWSQSLEGEPRHAAVVGPSAVTILALKALHPYQHRLLPASPGSAHLLWLDRADAGDDGFRLQAALLGSAPLALIGPTVLTRGHVSHYSALALADGWVRVVWAEGPPGAERLMTSQIDPAGRAQFAASLGRAGTYPALRQTTDGRIYLHWAADRGIWQAELANETLTATQRILDAPALARGERLEGVTATSTQPPTLWWQIVAADGTPRTLISALRQGTWHAPRPLSIAPQTTANRQTGYNSGTTSSAGWGAQAVGWAAPLPQIADILPAAVTLGDTLAVLYLHEGAPYAYQPLLAAGPLYSAPSISANQDRHLFVAWANPQDGAAQLLALATTP
jgi:hypothetical protein